MMRGLLTTFRRFSLVMAMAVLLTGCGPSYRHLRLQGQEAMIGGRYGPARVFFVKADERSPRRIANLYDLGTCSIMLARERFEQKNHAAAMREVDEAIGYFTQALDVNPGHQPSIEGLNTALELKGQFDEALAKAEWAARFVGPSAKHYVFLASELEERGDLDGALLRYRQAVSIEPTNVDAHIAFAKFLLRNNNEPAAIHHLQAAYRLNPLDQWVLDELAARGAVPALTAEKPGKP